MSAIRSWFDTPGRRAYVHAVVLAVFGHHHGLDEGRSVARCARRGRGGRGVRSGRRDPAQLGEVAHPALYGVALALQPIGIGFAFGTSEQWAAALVLLSAILGVGLAAARTPVPDEYTIAV